VITEVCTPLDEVLRAQEPVARQATTFVVARELAALLVQLHARRVVHRGVTRDNVVRVAARGGGVSWTLREFCCSVGEGRAADSERSVAQCLILPPEVRRVQGLGIRG